MSFYIFLRNKGLHFWKFCDSFSVVIFFLRKEENGTLMMLFQIITIAILSILACVSFSKFPLSELKSCKGETWKISNVIFSIWCYIETWNCLISSSTNKFLWSASSVLHKRSLLLYQGGSTWTPMCPALRQSPQFASQALPQFTFLSIFLSVSCSQSPVKSY